MGELHADARGTATDARHQHGLARDEPSRCHQGMPGRQSRKRERRRLCKGEVRRLREYIQTRHHDPLCESAVRRPREDFELRPGEGLMRRPIKAGIDDDFRAAGEISSHALARRFDDPRSVGAEHASGACIRPATAGPEVAMIRPRRLQPDDDLPRGWRWIGPVTPDEPVESVSFEDQRAHGTAPFQRQRVAGAAITRLWFPPRWVRTGVPPATANPSVLAAKIFVLHFMDCTLPKQRPGDARQRSVPAEAAREQ
jgi:hypothetical protein